MKISYLCGVLLVALLSSCVKHDNLYNGDGDSDKKKEEYDKNFPVKDIDPDQDWCNFTPVKVNMTVNEDLGETYTVKLYTANPMDEEANPLFLGKSEMKSGETSSVTVEIPEDLKSLWAVRLDKHNRCLFKQGAIVNGVVNVTFGSNSGKRSMGARAVAVRAVTAPDLPYTDEQVAEMIKDAKSITGDKVYTGGTYVINDGVSVENLSVSGGAIVIVKGAVENANITDGARLILYQGAAKLSGDIQVSKKSLLYVMPGSTFTLNNLDVTNNSQVYLKGKDNKQSSITTLNSDASSTFVNYYGRLVMETATAVNLENYCYMELTSNQISTINNLKMGEQSYLSAKQLQSTNIGMSDSGHDKKGEWYLDKYSIIDVENNFRAIRTNIIGPEGHEYALLRIRKNYDYNVEGHATEGCKVGYLANNLYIELLTLSAGKETSIYKLIEGLNGAGEIPGKVTQGNGNATLTLLNQAPIYVAPSECSGDGNNPTDEGGGMPDGKKMKYTFAFEDLGSIGDYDFNDVVLTVTDGSEWYNFNVYLVAAGGTLPVKVELWSIRERKYILFWEEIHSAFGVSQAVMVNTGVGTKAVYPKKEDLFKEDYFNNYADAQFRITVTNADGTKNESEIVSTPTNGTAPQCLRIAGNWKWPLETKKIILAYPDFEKYGQGDQSASSWYNNPDKDLVYNSSGK